MQTREDQASWPGLTMLFFGYFRQDAGSTKWTKRSYYGLAVLLAGMLGSTALKGVLSDLTLDIFVTALSVSGMGFVYWSLWRYMNDLDELHRRVMLEAIALSFFITMTTAIGIGVAELRFGTSVRIAWAFILGELMRGVGLVLAARKYR